MLKQLYVDNFKCLVNFELSPGPLTLLLGRNGSGKSAALEAFSRLRNFALGNADTENAFPRETLTRWDTRRLQTYAVQVGRELGTFEYRLELEHEEVGRRSRVIRERLTLDKMDLFDFHKGEVHLFRDDGSKGPVFPTDWSRSAMATVPPRNDNKNLTWFKQWVDRSWVIAPDPKRITGLSREEARQPANDLSNLASWYRHAVQEDVTWTSHLLSSLSSALIGFDSLNLKSGGGDLRILTVSRRSEATDRTIDYAFDELSEGERALVALYLILHLGIRSGATLCLDEPENYVAILELQPWLFALRDRLDETHGQVMLVSHSPELINYLASANGKLFERQTGGPTRVRDWVTEEGLTPAETFARGWE